MPTDLTRDNPNGGWARGPVDLLVGRLVGAGLLAWMAWIHLHLWKSGYKHLHIVGPSFLLNFIAGVILALAVLAVPARYVWLAAAAGALLAAGTLAGLTVSINFGLFGFKDSLEAPFAKLSIYVEVAAAVVLAAIAVRAALGRHRTTARSSGSLSDRPTDAATPSSGR
jgi:hypothetical protein